MTTALLILFGGRSMPNMLTIIHEKPTLVIAIVSQDEIRKLPMLENAIDALSKHTGHKPTLDTSYTIDAFAVSDIREKCIQAVKDHPGFDWIFNITAATTIMSLGAYNAAEELVARGIPVRCWYLNTLHTKVVALLGEGRDEAIFNITMDQYADVHNCRLASGTLEDQRQYSQEHWIPFSRCLVEHQGYIDLLKQILKQTIHAKGNKSPKLDEEPLQYSIILTNEEMYKLLLEAYKCNLVGALKNNGRKVSFTLSSIQANYLDGPWLEAYVWDEACKLKIFSDCQWNQRIIAPGKPDDKDSKNELDVSMIYKAQLIVAECKTEEKPFKTPTLYKFDSVTGPLGGRFVSKILITSFPVPDENVRESFREYKAFEERADERGIVIVTREKLLHVGKFIEDQATHPKLARI